MDDRKVLVVDDEADFLLFMTKTIESWGYEVVTAANGEQALDVFKEEKPDILILDYMMPDINGIELLRKIRQTDKNVPTIMFTAQPTMKAMKGGDELRVSAFIPKLSPLGDTQQNLKIALDLISERL